MAPRTITRVIEEAAPPPRIAPIAVGVEDAAEALHIGINTVRKLLDEGKIKGIKIGRSWTIPVAELHIFATTWAGKEIIAA